MISVVFYCRSFFISVLVLLLIGYVFYIIIPLSNLIFMMFYKNNEPICITLTGEKSNLFNKDIFCFQRNFFWTLLSNRLKVWRRLIFNAAVSGRRTVSNQLLSLILIRTELSFLNSKTKSTRNSLFLLSFF